MGTMDWTPGGDKSLLEYVKGTDDTRLKFYDVTGCPWYQTNRGRKEGQRPYDMIEGDDTRPAFVVPPGLPTNVTAEQCKMRWLNHVKPGLKSGGFSKDEMETIRDAVYVGMTARQIAELLTVPTR